MAYILVIKDLTFWSLNIFNSLVLKITFEDGT